MEVVVDRRTRVWWLILGMAVAATGLAYVALEVLDPIDHVPSVPWWSLAVCFAATEVFVVLLRSEKGAQSISLSEIPLVVGLAFTPAGGLLLARVLGAGRSRPPPQAAGDEARLQPGPLRPRGLDRVVVYPLVLGDALPGEPGAGSRPSPPRC